MSALPEKFLAHFETIEDPRVDNHNKRHLLIDIFVITLVAVIAGADNWVEIATYGESRREWFAGFLTLSNGILSHDTFNRVFSLLNPDQFIHRFTSWVREMLPDVTNEIIAIDGKSICSTHKSKIGKRALHFVSAWATNARLVLAQRKVDGKTNEIKIVPELLKLLDLAGKTVTLDAMGCQRAIADQVIAQGGHYLFAVKGNQGILKFSLEQAFEKLGDSADIGHRDTQVEKGHGRLEARDYRVLPVSAMVHDISEWRHCQSVVRVISERTTTKKNISQTSIETLYYISSHAAKQAKHICHAIRQHWQIENNLHWSLDVSFREDESTTAKGHCAENLALIRKLALNLVKHDNTYKASMRVKRKRAGWDSAFLKALLSQM